MKIISWNVQQKHKSITRFLKQHTDFDILCLQEVPATFQFDSNKYPQYQEVRVPDFIHKKERHARFLSVITKFPIVSVSSLPYYDQRVPSFLTLYYRLMGNYQVHSALVVTVMCDKKKYSIITVHLPIAANAAIRYAMLHSILEQAAKLENPIIIGDLNVYDRPFLTILFGLLRGFKARDLFVNERYQADLLFEQYHYNNIFKNITTSVYLPTQFDHILVPDTLKVSHFRRLKNYRSDHYAIEAEISD